MSRKGMTISAANASVKSNVKVQKILWGEKSVGITLSKEEAVQFARNLLVLATSEDIQGDTVVAGHPKQRAVSLLGYKTWRRNAKARDQPKTS